MGRSAISLSKAFICLLIGDIVSDYQYILNLSDDKSSWKISRNVYGLIGKNSSTSLDCHTALISTSRSFENLVRSYGSSNVVFFLITLIIYGHNEYALSLISNLSGTTPEGLPEAGIYDSRCAVFFHERNAEGRLSILDEYQIRFQNTLISVSAESRLLIKDSVMTRFC